eukprot:TRINITY_DN82543_c0_g1_i1.p1 TRINITY_DN82543_c0_g1~~TRINITY_DN82543_c0_g1_i1.p1  ORF type:complete len:399 (+),score=98.59 TRINITY_DN82543_c0_g1_i1:82-1278(+)
MRLLLVCVTFLVASVASDSGSRDAVEACLPFMHAWRNRFNKGDAEYCGAQYLDDASMFVRFGPASKVVASVLGGEDAEKVQAPFTIHGKREIAGFWHTAIDKFGLEKLTAYDQEGDYAMSALAQDSSTVLASGKLSFGAAISGHFSQTWVLDEGVWVVKSAILVVDKVDDALLAKQAAHAAAEAPSTEKPAVESKTANSKEIKLEVVKRAAEAESAAKTAETYAREAIESADTVTKLAKEEKASEGHAASETVEKTALRGIGNAVQKVVGTANTIEAAALAEKAEDAAAEAAAAEKETAALLPSLESKATGGKSAKGNGKVLDGKQEEPASLADASASHPAPGTTEPPLGGAEAGGGGAGGALLWLFLLGAGAFSAFYLYRAKRRRDMTIGGPDSLLG